MTASHYYEPEHMTKTSHGNVKACCDLPASDHRSAVNGTQVLVTLKRDVRGYEFRKGMTVRATLSVGDHWMRQVRPSRWGKNILGQFAELERAEYENVQSTSYTLRSAQGYGVAIPTKWAKEV